MAVDKVLAKTVHQLTERERQRAYDELEKIPLPTIFDYLRTKGYRVQLAEPLYDERKFN